MARRPTELTIGRSREPSGWEVEIAGRTRTPAFIRNRESRRRWSGALALAEIGRGGWFGKVRKDGKEGTSNVGSFAGRDGMGAGEATNVVTDYVHIRGESRSHDPRFFRMITKAYRDAFEKAANKVTDDKGRPAKVKFTSRLDYHPFKLRL